MFDISADMLRLAINRVPMRLVYLIQGLYMFHRGCFMLIPVDWWSFTIALPHLEMPIWESKFKHFMDILMCLSHLLYTMDIF